ncbi:Crp/Fnr family transcriptional regulator [Ferrovibrio sp.]|uniref:cyclic nucleotide-binding domain-containing protein n=1 Tax=Ferrovibrio sp. TaxID=1917215 RepID=UPI0025C1D7B4|nr:Crp/Fnr family transcriptional regulator [Ferrovibrio sp.]MBX3454156.1 Crp/Fnr family transcriptional regulator [Ferrovibrio sp.]
MSINEEVELLRRIPLFAKIEPAKLKLLAFTSQRITYKPGDTVFHQGDPGDAAYVIFGGEADVLVDTPSGPLTVARLKQNDFVGEIAILCDVPRTATVKAVSELVTLRITKDLFFRLITDFPQIAIEIMRVLAQRLERTTADLRSATAKQNGKT